MEKEHQIIARIKRKDGFIKEMIVDSYKPVISFVDVPPIKAYTTIEEVNGDVDKDIRRDFFPKRETIIIDYEEN